MRKKLFLIIVIALVAIAILPQFASSTAKDLEVKYPDLNITDLDVQTPNTVKTMLSDYIKYVIVLIVVLSGLIAFSSFFYAGFLYLTSSGNPSNLGQAKKKMGSSALGVIIIISSYLILNTINPQLVELQIDPKAHSGGVAFVDAHDEKYETTSNIADFNSTDIDQPIKVEFYSKNVEVIPCQNSKKDIGEGKEVFGPENCENIYPNAVTPSSTNFPAGARAAKLVWKIPGVYLYSKPGQKGEVRVYNASTGALTGFSGKAKSIGFLNPVNDISFGAVLHDREGFSGKCKFAWSDDKDSNLNMSVGSLTVFKYKNGMPFERGGVQFYKEPNYLSYPGGLFTKEKEWVSFADRHIPDNSINSIKIDGDYLVAIAEDTDGGGKCEIFTQSDSDLGNNDIGQCIFAVTCAPGCWGFQPYFCPACTASCASSFQVIPLAW